MKSFAIGHIGRKTFSLPPDLITQTLSIVAKRGVGKTYTAAVISEEMLKTGGQVIILDPLDVWWGLRASASGKGEGLPIIVLGGAHEDLPLSAESGKIIAEFAVEHSAPLIISMRHLSKGDQRRLVTDFCERLYHLKGRDENKTPLHIIIDEADAFVPQRIMRGQERMVGAVDDLVRRGRASGIGVTLITQRAAVIHKDVLTQTEVLVCLRLVSPQDRKAVDLWVEAHDAEDRRREFMASLASLPVGTAWFWSPGWLGLFEQVKVRQRTTFDSSATPKAGAAKAKTPKIMAAVDLETLRSQMESTIRQAEESDPRTLKHRIAELERQARAAKAPTDPAEIDRAVREAVEQRDQIWFEHFRKAINELCTVQSQITATLVSMETAEVPEVSSHATKARVQTLKPLPQTRQPRRKPVTPKPSSSSSRLIRAERRVLAALALYHPDSRTKTQVALLAGYSSRGGGFNNALSSLRNWDPSPLINGSGTNISITDDGLLALGEFDPLPKGQELIDFWLRHPRVDKAGREILQVLIDVHPRALTKHEIASRTASNYEPTGGGFNNSISRLRVLELIEGRGEMCASDTLFET